jgi:quinolinate synthase
MTDRMPFPALLIRSDGFSAEGAFAESQAAFLTPDPTEVEELTKKLKAKNVGIVAHFYMDPELQGVLTASSHPHIQISDSLVMADRAVAMAKAGASTIVVLGVDFMSENVRAILDVNGFEKVPVYRVASEPIGCSLAESAEALAYGAYLTRAAKTPRSLHVIYINTSLRTKAQAQALVPTITCTSSNVLKTVLQAFAQIPDVNVWFGPDTYMGHNLHELFSSMRELDDAAIRAVHPAHDRKSLEAVVARFRGFEQGTCVVHHMFGAEVAERVRREYADAFVTAHLEVPGEMFSVALEAQRRGAGVVGSTSDILNFIGGKVDEAVKQGQARRLRFVLGTEAGMITSIVRRVKKTLATVEASGGPNVEVEIVFPVASEAIATTGDAALPVVPGVMGGEGCSTAGGCATCPYMKMNSLDALMGILDRINVVPGVSLATFEPKKYGELIAGRSAADLGGIPILAMRGFHAEGRLPDSLVNDILTRTPSDDDQPRT